MEPTFYFYDLETSGLNPREQRIMQFAGQRTDMQLRPVGEPHNVLVKLTDDIVPEPFAVLITGITPQQTQADGLTEAEFLRLFHEEIAIPGTVFVGFNTIRFDDEFMRFLHYRNFYDPYTWHWKDGRSRWDLLDLTRMTRALRPEGIKWPVDSEGKPTNRLELLTALNGLTHEKAHDALSDVRASIAVAKLIQTKQPKLFQHLFRMREKASVEALVGNGQPFVYTSGRYASETEKTTVVKTLMSHPTRKGQGVLVYDLRVDPTPFLQMQPAELAACWTRKRDDPGPRLPVKTLLYNRCPAVAPLGVLDVDPAVRQRLQLDAKTLQANEAVLQAGLKTFNERLVKALEILDTAQQTRFMESEQTVDGQLYDGFLQRADETPMSLVRAARADELRTLQPEFTDARLTALLPLYKARNYPKILSDDERQAWESYRTERLMSGGTKSRLAHYFDQLAQLAQKKGLTDKERYLLEELQLYGQSIVPEAAF